MTVLVDTFDESIPGGPTDDAVARREVLADLLQGGIASGKLVESDRPRDVFPFDPSSRSRVGGGVRRSSMVSWMISGLVAT